MQQIEAICFPPPPTRTQQMDNFSPLPLASSLKHQSSRSTPSPLHLPLPPSPSWSPEPSQGSKSILSLQILISSREAISWIWQQMMLLLCTSHVELAPFWIKADDLLCCRCPQNNPLLPLLSWTENMRCGTGNHHSSTVPVVSCTAAAPRHGRFCCCCYIQHEAWMIPQSEYATAPLITNIVFTCHRH
ncbi:hypothetical protein BDA96_01G340900 [Sorghum bicolor]|uniref:Uncharacterized protein n=2 Tax=Sorghum bicolor TaxID=4558 RepID=A0A921V0T0_SORBI|nr:hypothetical protein BDA96_01G340900 [Sorghum bicolor]KAG0550466.1 hypothetical protein BDA96_01G340900 [Sorghum bicolor]OQU92257.1 hypothetical protein SORBI_3001G317950 [Sorghum bicolor]OQU92258.1 hypothetical protein SORBI_3001G317950 [Sorghum bicolor]